MAELDIFADSEEEARQEALNRAQRGRVLLTFPDCGAIAISYKEDKKEA